MTDYSNVTDAQLNEMSNCIAREKQIRDQKRRELAISQSNAKISSLAGHISPEMLNFLAPDHHCGVKHKGGDPKDYDEHDFFDDGKPECTRCYLLAINRGRGQQTSEVVELHLSIRRSRPY